MTQYEAIDFVRAIKKVARTFPEGINQFMMFGEETIAKYALEEYNKNKKSSST